MAYDNPGGIIAAAVILFVLSATLVFLRFRCRHTRKAGYSWDDYLMVLALAFAAATNIVIIYGAAPGVKAFAYRAGSDKATATYGERVRLSDKLEFVLQTYEALSVGVIKLSVALFYRRIFSTRTGTSMLWDWVINIWIGLLVIWTVAFTFALIFQCGVHPDALWPETLSEYLKYCTHNLKIYYWFFGSDVAMDIITVLLPLPKIHTLHLTFWRKVELALVMLVALLSVGASIGVLTIYLEIIEGLYTSDAIISNTSLATWHMIEVNVGIIAACLPSCRPVLQQIQSSSSFIQLVSFVSSVRSRNGSDTGHSTSRHETASEFSRMRLHGRASYSARGDAFTSSNSDIEAAPADMESRDAQIFLRKDVFVEGRRVATDDSTMTEKLP